MDMYTEFAKKLVKNVLKYSEHLKAHETDACKLLAPTKTGRAVLDLTPFKATKQPVTATSFFGGVKNFEALKSAYSKARQSIPFEESIIANEHKESSYVALFLGRLFEEAEKTITDDDVKLIVAWIKDLDVYVAVKAVESLLNSKADLAMFKAAQLHGWDIHFDHLAIRCGSSANQDVERIAELLKTQHGYVQSQVETEARYQFPDGWNAIPLYKILENGQVLRVFLDQSNADDKKQIIQHWNYVYGFTAHHLAMHATKIEDGVRVAVPLDEARQALKAEGVDILTPVGDYTKGLLEQVFTKPEKTQNIPEVISYELALVDKNLPVVIQNAKLLELLARNEMSADLAKDFFALYDIAFDKENKLHSAPIFTYFLPAQAAHVIRTSQET